VNFGTPVPLLLGIFLVLGAVALFFLERFRPGYGRDSDRVYAILMLISGVFLLGHLTMELIPSFQQMIMVGMLTALLIQNINAREPYQGRPAPQGDGRDGYGGGGYRPPSRPSRPVYGGDSRANMRAELDRRDYGLEDPYARPRPMLGGRDEGGRPYSQPSGGYAPDPYSSRYDDRGGMPPSQRPDNFGDQRPGDRPSERPGERPDGAGYGDGSAYSEESVGPIYSEGSTYSSAPRADERLRRRRPKTRSDYQDRYRPDSGNPPRPDYRPGGPSDGWG
jgi:hypothetical protein